ncbi:MAG: FliA/WhiG family RNA polymerase sigma factor [Planctomycetes bacterium]|nr:FliA/WhiG family RNA polymerase sigma factor [Planctomycetota bacterium]
MTRRSDEERDRLVLEHVPLLRHVVGRMSLPSGVDREDFLGWGMVGLLAAADSWDEARGLKFSTYAFPRIRGAILDELRRADLLPRGRRETLRAVERATAQLEQELGMPPALEQIAERTGLLVDEVESALADGRAVVESSLDQESGSGPLADLLSDPHVNDPMGSAAWQETKARLAAAIQALPEQERTVILLYYAEEMLLKDIGEVLGVTESRVSQIHSKAIYRLNRELALAHGEVPR